MHNHIWPYFVAQWSKFALYSFSHVGSLFLRNPRR